MKKVFYTYAYLREDGSPYYIGKGKGKRAWWRCKGDVCPPRDKNRVLILKSNLSEEEAYKHEIYLIFVFGRKDNGTGILRNKTNGGDGSRGTVRTEETRRKIGNAHRGKTLTEEHKLAVSRYRTGRKMSEEQRQKISDRLRGEGNPNFGKRGEESPLFGSKRTAEQRANIADGALQRWERDAKSVEVHTPEGVALSYASAHRAGHELGLDPETIRNWIKKGEPVKQGKHKGYSARYV
jgi:hypothetical protein